MTPSGADGLEITTAVERLPGTNDLCGAASHVDFDSTTLCFFDLLRWGGGFSSISLREVRVFSTDESRMRNMTEQELKRRLLRWIKSDRPMLPIEKRSIRHNDPTLKSVDVSQLRQLPIPLMERLMFQRADLIRYSEDFIGPSNAEMKRVIRHPGPLGFKSERSLRAHLRQLQAVEQYLQAATHGSLAPLLQVQKSLGVSANTARNLIQRARENGYLTASRSGKAIGRATDKARDFTTQVKEFSLHLRRESRR